MAKLSDEQREEIINAVGHATIGDWVYRENSDYGEVLSDFHPDLKVCMIAHMSDADILTNAKRYINLLLDSEKAWRDETERLQSELSYVKRNLEAWTDRALEAEKG